MFTRTIYKQREENSRSHRQIPEKLSTKNKITANLQFVSHSVGLFYRLAKINLLDTSYIVSRFYLISSYY